MKTAALLLIALFCCGCAERASVSHGGVIVAPQADQTSAATEDLIAQKAAALAAKDKARADALEKALQDQDAAELNGGLRWETLVGVLIMAVGAGIMWYLGRYTGGGVLVIGAIVTFGAMTVHEVAPYWKWVTLGAGFVALAAGAFHLRNYVSALAHVAHGTEAVASAGTKALIGKVRERGVPFLTKLKSLIHHAPLSTATVTINKPPSA